jgi:hypothetical protein
MKSIFRILAAVLVLTMPLAASAQMRTEANTPQVKKQVELSADVVVCGGGLAGVCAAVSAARHGSKVILVQDRPVLGGNASSEMRMGIVGAKTDDTQETGILEEMQLRNFYYNPLQRYTMWDDAIYSTVISEPNIKLLLNTSVNDVVMNGERIAAIKAWNINAYTDYTIGGTIFIDCTGDGILRLSGAKYRHGRENPKEFDENYLQQGNDAKTMGNSILLQLRKTDVDVPFKAPEWAYHFTDDDFNYDTPKSTIPGLKFNYKRIYHPHDNNFWWCEFGGNFDTIADANDIQFELKRIVYGIWEYMKNHPDGRGKGYELDWIGALPGKRENTRFVGPHILTQNDILSGGHFPDVVAYGGWTLDDHHPDAFHRKGVMSNEYTVPQGFGIPFGCLYSVNVPNLMFAGRDISATHMGLSATRVMATCALLGQAAGTGAAKAIEKGVEPAEAHKSYIGEIQAWLEDDDVMLPYRWRTVSELTAKAKVAEEVEPIRNGIDRKWQGEDNGVWVAPNENTITYTWKKPVTISGARMIFDSDLKVRSKRMRKLEATTERVEIPKMMTKSYKIEALVGKEWKTIYSESDNYLRLRKVSFEPVETKQLRLVVTETWGAEKAHIFAFDAL